MAFKSYGENYNTPNEEIANTTYSYEDTNALRINNKCLKNKNNNTPSTKVDDELSKNFELIWEEYPRKERKTDAFRHYVTWLKGKKVCGKNIKLSNRQIWSAVHRYKEKCEDEETEMRFIQQGGTFFNNTILDYVGEYDE